MVDTGVLSDRIRAVFDGCYTDYEALTTVGDVHGSAAMGADAILVILPARVTRVFRPGSPRTRCPL